MIVSCCHRRANATLLLSPLDRPAKAFSFHPRR
jgi:hypothetical protein